LTFQKLLVKVIPCENSENGKFHAKRFELQFRLIPSHFAHILTQSAAQTKRKGKIENLAHFPCTSPVLPSGWWAMATFNWCIKVKQQYNSGLTHEHVAYI
jgi:hypothetical protein